MKLGIINNLTFQFIQYRNNYEKKKLFSNESQGLISPNQSLK